MRNYNQILHGDQDVRKTFTWSTMNADARSVCGSLLFLFTLQITDY